MTLKDDIAADLDEVFFNEDEFASLHSVEGRTILCVVDSDSRQPSDKGGAYALSEADYVLHAKTADMPPRKEAGELLNLDGKELTIGKWDEQDGVTIVELFTPEV